MLWKLKRDPSYPFQNETVFFSLYEMTILECLGFILKLWIKKSYFHFLLHVFFQLIHSQLILSLIFIIDENGLLHSLQKSQQTEKKKNPFLLSCMSKSEKKNLAIQIPHQPLLHNKTLYSSTDGAQTAPHICLSLQITKFSHSLWIQKLIILYKVDIESWGIVREIMDDVTTGRARA